MRQANKCAVGHYQVQVVLAVYNPVTSLAVYRVIDAHLQEGTGHAQHRHTTILAMFQSLKAIQ